MGKEAELDLGQEPEPEPQPEPEPEPVRFIYRRGFWTNCRDLAKMPVATLLFNRKRSGARVRARVRASPEPVRLIYLRGFWTN